jgi:GWxTD domain-containing protein
LSYLASLRGISPSAAERLSKDSIMSPVLKYGFATALLVALTLAWGVTAAAQDELAVRNEEADQDLPTKSQGPVSFTIDTGVFFVSNGPPVVKVYLETSYDELSFIRRGGGYVSHLEFAAIFLNRSGDQVGGDSWNRDIWVEDYEETVDPDRTYRAVAKFSVPPGEYDLRVTCDGEESGLQGLAQRHFKVPRPPSEGLNLSDMTFGQCEAADSTGAGGEAADSTGARNAGRGDEGGRSFVPSATRSFGEATRSFCVAIDAYAFPEVEGDSLLVDAAARGEDGRTAWTGYETVPRAGWDTPLTLTVPVDSLSWGTYRLSLEVSAGGSVAKTERDFEIDETRVGVSMDREEFMDLMSLVATPEELETLASLRGSERRAYLESIWKKRDPDPSTPRNEFRELFFKRVKYAKRNYAERGREGWQTDRGRVFIKNGPPDRIDVRTGVVGSLSPDAKLEIWYYDGTNTHYVFEDFGGSGEYTLVDVVQG